MVLRCILKATLQYGGLSRWVVAFLSDRLSKSNSAMVIMLRGGTRRGGALVSSARGQPLNFDVVWTTPYFQTFLHMAFVAILTRVIVWTQGTHGRKVYLDYERFCQNPSLRVPSGPCYGWSLCLLVLVGVIQPTSER